MHFLEGKLKAVTFSFDEGCREDIKLAIHGDNHRLRG